MATGLEKVNPYSSSQEGQYQSIGQLHSLPMLVKVMIKILHARLQHYVNQEFPDVQAGLEKEEELEIKLPTFAGL